MSHTRSRRFRRKTGRRSQRQPFSWELIGRALALVAFTVVFAGALLFAFDSLPERESRNKIESEWIQSGVPNGSQSIASERRVEGSSASTEADQVSQHEHTFTACRKVRINCVVDGDTFWIAGQKVRILDIDTPEIGKPACLNEYKLAIRAKDRLIQLLNEGPFQLRVNGGNRRDIYGRLLAAVYREDISIGDRLIEEGLAHRWLGRKQSWCNSS